MFNFTNTEGSNLTLGGTLEEFGASASNDLTITGTANNDTISDRRQGWTGDLNISTGSGIDIIAITTSTGTDTVDAGAGNDFVYVSQAYTSDTSLNGGADTDWLIIEGSSNNLTYTINSGVTSGFENIRSYGNGNDALTGDSAANIIEGGAGADTLTGGDGNDSLYGYFSANAGGSSGEGDDTLYGGSGNDILVGGAGDDIVDGGTGADTLTGDGGSSDYDRGGAAGTDTFILRVGDGGSTLADADTITDFTDGSDKLGMDNNLQYSQLTYTQGTGSNSSDTIISVGSEYLAILTGISISALSEADFTPVDIV
jgi:Ca2+-binding RTX toxin-like protein